jgi:DNA anti-recombination protein RmuC
MAKEEKQTKEKSLDKMTATELREVAKEIPDITGAHGMKKAELLAAIKKAKGIEDTVSVKNRPAVLVRNLKTKIKDLKKQRAAYLDENNKKMADIFRRRINRLKKKTRKVA